MYLRLSSSTSASDSRRWTGFESRPQRSTTAGEIAGQGLQDEMNVGMPPRPHLTLTQSVRPGLARPERLRSQFDDCCTSEAVSSFS